jgi:hypothetical protein
MAANVLWEGLLAAGVGGKAASPPVDFATVLLIIFCCYLPSWSTSCTATVFGLLP